MEKKTADLAVMYQVVIFKNTGEWIEYETAVQALKQAAKGE